ncbi:MAG: iron ABC transporter permease [candidate division KSB1 bacterium]|nr:iron ABC transporter permease [candidate division KSB1 bacterium]MDZ7301087.1 iron ABC transporter permease [candidate division KSB1 bacterium]MDZ7312089.1 iron ABC transporter permease [candidate division KSB1 bacterium]
MKRYFPSFGYWSLLLPLFFILAVAILFPLAVLLRESLQGDGHFSFANYRRFFDFTRTANLQALLGSLNISVLTVVFSALLGIPLAIFFIRFDFPGRKLFGVLVTLPILLPPLVGVLAFYFLLGESGILPRLLQALLGLQQPPLVMKGVPAILIVHVYSFYVYFYLFVRNALMATDPALEEAARGLGANRFLVWRRVIFPQLLPAILGAALLVFMSSMASFTAPYLFGGNWRFLTLEIYNSKLNGDLPMAITQAVILAGISLLFLILIRWYGGTALAGFGRGSKGVIAAVARNYRHLSWPQKILLTIIGGGMMLLLVLPQLTLVMMAFVKNGTWTWQVLPDTFTFENFTALITEQKVAKPLWNSLWMSAGATLVGALVALIAAWLQSLYSIRANRTQVLANLIDFIVMVPYAIPGTVVGIALIVAFNEPHWFTASNVLVGTVAILPLAYFIRHLPIQFRATAAAFAQFDPALDEAARNLGARWWRRLYRVTLPLILPGVATGAMVALLSALGEFVSSILLYTYANVPLSIAIFAELRLFNLGTAAAYSVLLTALIGVVMWLTQKWIGERGTAI